MSRRLSHAIALCGLLFAAAQSAKAQSPGGSLPLPAVVAAMSDSEKVRLVVGVGLILPEGVPTNMMPPGMLGSARTPDDRPLRVPGSAGETHAVRRLGIPSITLSDGPAGVRIDPIRNGANGKPDSSRTFYATAFPVGTLLASSWDTALVRRVGVAFGEEARDYGIDVLLMPGMNLHRNPLGGRNFEYYSEDPLVTGLMASAMVTGVQSAGVGTSVKHFVANEQEFNRMRINSAIGERAFRELYLRPFQTVVRRAKPWTVMSSYNLVNGTHTAENRELLTDILRGEWNFGGLVMSDWFGGEDPIAMVNAGNDVMMPGTAGQEVVLRAALASGKLSRAALDASVTRLLELVLRSNTFRAVRASDKPDLRGHAAVARLAAAESMVLLRNELIGTGAAARHALPLAPGNAVAAFGNTSYDAIAGGTGSGNVNRAYTISIAQGLESARARIDTAVSSAYARYLIAERAKLPPLNPMNFFAPPPIIPEMTADASVVTQAAERADVALITLGRIAGEGGDRQVTDDFTLRASERALIETVATAFHARGKRVVVVLNVGGPVEIASWRGQVDAVLLAYQPGQEGGLGVADVLLGNVNPSGKLATSFPVSYDDVPYAAEFPGRVRAGSTAGNPMTGQPSDNSYDEGVFVGYRYSNTFGKMPAYAFGFGMSYTSFAFGALQVAGTLRNAADAISVKVTVTNTGRVAGREVVQLYVSAPRSGLDKPERELRAFAKTGTLAPGASETVTFRLSAADLASFNVSAAAWLADAGTYTLRISNSSSADGVQSTFALARRVIVERTRHLVVPTAPLSELKAPAR
jgi:beta-glucosidase